MMRNLARFLQESCKILQDNRPNLTGEVQSKFIHATDLSCTSQIVVFKSWIIVGLFGFVRTFCFLNITDIRQDWIKNKEPCVYLVLELKI